MSGYLGGLGSAAQSVGSSLYQQSGLAPAVSGLQNVASGLQSLFGGDSPAPPPAANFVGPPAPEALVSGPGFGQGFLEGFTNTLQRYGDPSAGTALGQGLGELARFIDEHRSGSGTLEDRGLAPIVDLGSALGAPLWKRRPSPVPPVVKPEPTLIGNLVSAYTGGILRGAGA